MRREEFRPEVQEIIDKHAATYGIENPYGAFQSMVELAPRYVGEVVLELHREPQALSSRRNS